MYGFNGFAVYMLIHLLGWQMASHTIFSCHGFDPQGIHCMPRTSDLNEELGQVEYVFSATWYKLCIDLVSKALRKQSLNPTQSLKLYISIFDNLHHFSRHFVNCHSCQVTVAISSGQNRYAYLLLGTKMYGALTETGFKLVKGWEFGVFQRVKSQEADFSRWILNSFQAM